MFDELKLIGIVIVVALAFVWAILSRRVSVACSAVGKFFASFGVEARCFWDEVRPALSRNLRHVFGRALPYMRSRTNWTNAIQYLGIVMGGPLAYEVADMWGARLYLVFATGAFLLSVLFRGGKDAPELESDDPPPGEEMPSRVNGDFPRAFAAVKLAPDPKAEPMRLAASGESNVHALDVATPAARARRPRTPKPA